MERCTFIGTDIGIRFKTAAGRGGIVEDITIRDINMMRIPGEAILFTMGYVLQTVKNGDLCCDEHGNPEDIPEIKNIRISHVRGCDIEWGIRIAGLEQMPVHDIFISDVILDARNESQIINGENINLCDVHMH